MKRLNLTLATLSIALLAQPAFAGEPGEKPKAEKRASAEQPLRNPGKRVRERADRDPAKMVSRLLEQFDHDGDQKLDAEELTEALTAIRERMNRGRAARAEGRGGRHKDSDAAPGGQRPKRPSVE